jgi:hypothetical protein
MKEVIFAIRIYLWRVFHPKVQLQFNELLFIAKAIQSYPNCQLLVFGLGYDTPLWKMLNHEGRTAFLEDNDEFFNLLKRKDPNLEAYRIKYCTKISDWRELLKDASVPGDLPLEIQHTKWDVIIVDAPCGDLAYFEAKYNKEPPGRMGTIYLASQVIKPAGTIFVHDCERPVEEAFCRKYLSPFGAPIEVKGRALLRSYRRP